MLPFKKFVQVGARSRVKRTLLFIRQKRGVLSRVTMDAATKEKVEETVLEVLRNADMEAMTEFKIRQIATEKLGIDLSEPSRKKFVRQIVEDFLAQQQQQQQHQQQQQQQNDAVSTGEVEEKQEEEDNNNDGREYDDDGDLIVCRVNSSSLLNFYFLLYIYL